MTFATDDGARHLADDLAAAVDAYASLFETATRIAASGAAADEIAAWASDCFDEARSLRLLEADSIGFVDDVPEDARVLVRELYESLVDPVRRRAARARALDARLDLPRRRRPRDAAARARRARSLVRRDRRTAVRDRSTCRTRSSIRQRASPSPFGFGEGKQLAANADRELVEEERSRDLNDVFAGRLVDALRLYEDALAEVRREPPGHDLQASLTLSARAVAPALLGFARLADRRTVRLDPPAAAAPTARLVSDGFMTLAAAETPEDIATLPYPSADEVADAARPLRNWLGRLGTL